MLIFWPMNRIALYRKYRPHNFDNLVGQEHVHDTLINAIKDDRVAHAYLFSGPRGTGKTSSARLLAKALMCADIQNGYEPCDKCDFCNDINDGRLIDLVEIDAASNRGIDEVRDLNEKIRFSPTRSKYKVYIIDEVHMMTKEAFNALLKTLEEPPSHAYFVLATTEVHKIPDTIISRCQRFDFKRLSEKAIMARLSFIAQSEKIDAEEDALVSISHYVDGGMRDAIGLLEQLTVDSKLKFSHVQEILGISNFGLLEQLCDDLMAYKTQESLKVIHSLHDQGSDLRQFSHEFVDLLRKRLLDSVKGTDIRLTARLISMIEIFQEAQGKIGAYDIPQLSLEIAVIRIAGGVENVVIEKEVPSAAKLEAKVNNKAEPGISAQPVPKAVIEETVRKNVPAGPITIAKVKDGWPRITERIKSPALRMSLRGAVPVSIDGSDLTLEFSTQFHRDKTMEHDSRVELEKVLEEFFGSAFKIKTTLKPLEMKPVIHEEADTYAPEPEPTPDMMNEALDIFGGEVVD